MNIDKLNMRKKVLLSLEKITYVRIQEITVAGLLDFFHVILKEVAANKNVFSFFRKLCLASIIRRKLFEQKKYFSGFMMKK